MTARAASGCLAAALLLTACTTARAPAPQPPEPQIVPLTLEQQWDIDEPRKRAGT